MKPLRKMSDLVAIGTLKSLYSKKLIDAERNMKDYPNMTITRAFYMGQVQSFTEAIEDLDVIISIIEKNEGHR